MMTMVRHEPSKRKVTKRRGMIKKALKHEDAIHNYYTNILGLYCKRILKVVNIR